MGTDLLVCLVLLASAGDVVLSLPRSFWVSPLRRVEEWLLPPTDLWQDEENTIPYWSENSKRQNAADPYETMVQEWLDRFNQEFREFRHQSALLNWEYNTNITADNARKIAELGVAKAGWIKPWRVEAQRFDLKRLSPLVRRQVAFLRRGSKKEIDPQQTRQLIDVQSKLQELYNTGKVCLVNGTCYSGEPDLARFMQTSRDYDQLLWAWKAWHDVVGPPMKHLYTKLIYLLNNEAQLTGYPDMGQVWREEVETNDLESEVEDLFQKILPLYEQLHAYVRYHLVRIYGPNRVSVDGPIPAHLLGNMWAQQWDALYDYILPYPKYTIPDVTQELINQDYTPLRMFVLAEDFFTSIGLEPMTKEFWERSIIEKPKDGREIACHGSATNFFDGKDYRIRMCTEVTQRDLNTIHHEMGHVEYFMAYRNQPILFQEGANSAFHEAIGDTVQYSVVTPEHLHHVRLLNSYPKNFEATINFLLKQALVKLPLIPFSLALDRWRWEVFRGRITERNYNREWWRIRFKYQGVAPPVPRSEKHFDPGSKYHIPDNTPYIRYFLSSFMQMQFHEALCLEKDDGELKEPIFRCDIYGSKKAGARFKSMLSLGASVPWQDAMETMTGQRAVQADSLLRYYEPLYKWLQKENQRTGATIGWNKHRRKKWDQGGVL